MATAKPQRRAMSGNQIINMMLSVRDPELARVAILEFEVYADRRAEQETLDRSRVRRGIVSRVTKEAFARGARKALVLLNQAQDALVEEGLAVGAARFDGIYVGKSKKKAKEAPAKGAARRPAVLPGPKTAVRIAGATKGSPKEPASAKGKGNGLRVVPPVKGRRSAAAR